MKDSTQAFKRFITKLLSKQERLEMMMKACAVLDKIEICIISNVKNNVISSVTSIQYMKDSGNT